MKLGPQGLGLEGDIGTPDFLSLFLPEWHEVNRPLLSPDEGMMSPAAAGPKQQSQM